jgi:hypothetical protein
MVEEYVIGCHPLAARAGTRGLPVLDGILSLFLPAMVIMGASRGRKTLIEPHRGNH